MSFKERLGEILGAAVAGVFWLPTIGGLIVVVGSIVTSRETEEQKQQHIDQHVAQQCDKLRDVCAVGGFDPSFARLSPKTADRRHKVVHSCQWRSMALPILAGRLATTETTDTELLRSKRQLEARGLDVWIAEVPPNMAEDYMRMVRTKDWMMVVRLLVDLHGFDYDEMYMLCNPLPPHPLPHDAAY